MQYFLSVAGDFHWYDAPCHIRGFPTKAGEGFSLQPLCEHPPNTTEQFTVCEGCDQDWLPAAGRLYKFIQTDGVTFQVKNNCILNF